MRTQMIDYGLLDWETDPLKSDFHFSPLTAKIQDLENSGENGKVWLDIGAWLMGSSKC